MGKFGSPYGTRGWLRLFSFTDERTSIFDYSPLYVKQDGHWTEITISQWKNHNKSLVCAVDTIATRNDAQLWTNVEVYADTSNLPALPEDEHYWQDLYNMEVVTTKGYHLGQVDSILETGSNDVLVVKANDNDAFGQKERLVPFIEKQVIVNVDYQLKQIEVDWDPDF